MKARFLPQGRLNNAKTAAECCDSTPGKENERIDVKQGLWIAMRKHIGQYSISCLPETKIHRLFHMLFISIVQHKLLVCEFHFAAIWLDDMIVNCFERLFD